jgi:hypothetical protein
MLSQVLLSFGLSTRTIWGFVEGGIRWRALPLACAVSSVQGRVSVGKGTGRVWCQQAGLAGWVQQVVPADEVAQD